MRALSKLTNFSADSIQLNSILQPTTFRVVAVYEFSAQDWHPTDVPELRTANKREIVCVHFEAEGW